MRKYGIKENDTIIASFGYVSPTKRIHQALHALSGITSDNYKYLLVGEGDYVKDLVKKYKLENKVIFAGYTSLEEFDDLISLSDIIINLRYPYMGETSASLIRALLLGKASIVTDIGWFAELPNDVVIKIPVEGEEIKLLRDSIDRLISDPAYRQNLEMNARMYSKKHLDPDVIAQTVIKYIKHINQKNSREKMAYLICDRISVILDEIGIGEKNDEIIKSISQKIYNLF
jgi:glycosyltransferase involved in cell wall biosynthesis